MVIYPAIDLVDGKAVRLFKGDYAQMTVYSDDPVSVAKDFQAAGSRHIHLVDLEGAKLGTTPEGLRAAFAQGGLNGLSAALSPQQAEKAKALTDNGQVEGLLSDPAVQRLLIQLLGQ